MRLEYTKEVHKTILKEMLSQHTGGVKLMALCPAKISHKLYGYDYSTDKICNMCCYFVGPNEVYHDSCPCTKFGEEEALRRTIENLKKD